MEDDVKNKLRWFILSGLILFSFPARAANPEANLNDFNPSLHAWDVANIMTTRIAPSLRFSGGMWFNYRRDPWSVDTSSGNIKILRNQVLMEFYAALPIADLLSIGFGMPVNLSSSGDNPAGMLNGFNQVSGGSFGDLRLSAKIKFWKNKNRGFGIGLGQDLTFPTATGEKYSGEASVTWKTSLIFDYSRKGFVVALNLGYLVRKNDERVAPAIADELNFGIGLQVPLICDRLDLLFSWNFRAPVSSPFSGENNVGSLLLAGLKIRLWKGLFLALTGGGGLGHMYGLPKGQIGFNFGWEPKTKHCGDDRDGDSIIDSEDRCPDVAGTSATRGCPDKDGDGIADSSDVCPEEKGPRVTHGCPDRDGDGLIDKADRCPDKPGPREYRGCPDFDKDKVPDIDDRCPRVAGLVRLRGCPLKDYDRDGIPDDKDKCPRKRGIAKFDGCPDTDGDGVQDSKDLCPYTAGRIDAQGCPDRDRDGVRDKKDRCPDKWGRPEYQGCPPPTPKKIRITRKSIVILQKVHFNSGSSRIKYRSFGILKDVAKVLKENTWLQMVQIEGHTDDVGRLESNMKLSIARANSVRRYLIKRGVAPHRLEAKGFGPNIPLVEGKTWKARAKNRRVEFKILKTSK